MTHRDEQAEFYQSIYAGSAGWMCIAYPWGKFYEHKFFRYPNDLTGALDYIKYSFEHVDVFHGAHLYMDPTYRRVNEKGKRFGTARVKENSVLWFRTAWADLDEIEPTATRVQPSYVIETSPKRYQTYWLLPDLKPALEVEQLNQQIIHDAKGHSNDKSGWCLTKLLRVPWSLNHKPKYFEELGYKPEVVLWP